VVVAGDRPSGARRVPGTVGGRHLRLLGVVPRIGEAVVAVPGPTSVPLFIIGLCPGALRLKPDGTPDWPTGPPRYSPVQCTARGLAEVLPVAVPVLAPPPANVPPGPFALPWLIL